ncbi:MAG: HD domain-containing phosphohydrolase [Bdellovibrionota bacterium]
MQKILLLDDDDLFRRSVKTILEKKGHLVIESALPSIALSMLKKRKFDLIISDIQMPEETGVSFMQKVKALHDIPVVLMTGYSQILDAAEAAHHGASGFLTKPFNPAELLDLVESLSASARSADSAKQAYCRIGLTEFLSGSKIQYEIFAKVGEKHIRIATKGEDLDPEKVETFRAKGLEFLYMKAQDYAAYTGLTLTLAAASLGHKQVQERVRSWLHLSSGLSVLEHLSVLGVEKRGFEFASQFTENTFSMLARDKSCSETINLLYSTSSSEHAHSVGVAIVGAMLAKAVGWTTPSNLSKVVLAGIFHNIGLKELPPDLLTKPRASLNAQERKLYESHTIRGYEILSSLDFVPSDVAVVALEHHEDCLGYGYPRGLAGSKISPLSKLISVADNFVEFALQHRDEKKTAKEIAAHLLNTKKGSLHDEFLTGLLKIVT